MNVQQVKYAGNYALLTKGVPMTGTQKNVRIIDSNKIAINVCKLKFKEYNELIDVKVQLQFCGVTK